MSTYITRFADEGSGIAVAIKDLIDVAGTVTTAGCRALASTAVPAVSDAACLGEIRRREALGELWLVGKTNLHELAYGTTGVNPWYGTPTNPLDPALVPGGSSSGSAVAVAVGDADVGLGTDTGGSVRIPAACCGVAGLKTTWGRVPTGGVWPLAPSLDTVGVLARDVAGLVLGMQLLERGFSVPAGGSSSGWVVGRLRFPDVDPAIDAAIDAALSGVDVVEVAVNGWDGAWRAAGTVLAAEAWRVDGALLTAHPDGVGEVTATRLRRGADITVDDERSARIALVAWQQELALALEEVHALALPTMAVLPPRIDAGPVNLNGLTLPVNAAGLPALSLPVGFANPAPASLQLVGPAYGEELLLALGAAISDAAGELRDREPDHD